MPVTSYKVFVRNWWRFEGQHGRLVPDPGARKHTLATRLTEDEARAMCKEWNATHKSGQLSRKAEFEQEGC